MVQHFPNISDFLNTNSSAVFQLLLATMNVVVYLFLFSFFASLIAIDTPCKLARIADLLDCSDRALRHVPENRNRYQRVCVLDMRYNSISSVSEKRLIQEYPSLQLVDVRANPRVCDGIMVSTVTALRLHLAHRLHLVHRLHLAHRLHL